MPTGRSRRCPRSRSRRSRRRRTKTGRQGMLVLGFGKGGGSADEDVNEDEIEPPPAAVSFWRLFDFADGLDWALMAAGAVAAAAHDAALVVYLH